MAAVNFPDSPTVGQSFSASGKTWTWSGSIWALRVASATRDAYDIAVDNGFSGTEQQWLDSLVGADGADGTAGADGAPYGNIDGGLPDSVYGGLSSIDGGTVDSF